MTEDESLRERFAALFRERYAELCHFVLPFVRSRPVAEELVQDLFLRIWERRQSWEEELPSRSHIYQAGTRCLLVSVAYVPARRAGHRPSPRHVGWVDFSPYLSLVQRHLTARLPGGWMGHAQFEDLLAGEDYRSIIASGGYITFEFPPSSALPAYVGLRLLSLANQLVQSRLGRVGLTFQDREGLFGYLERNGFLDLLDPRIETVPERPSVSKASTLRGRTVGLVEIRELRLGAGVQEQQETVKELSDALLRLYPTSPRAIRLGKNVYSVLGELIGNVYNHSQTAVSGFAILQAYLRGQRPRVQIAVSDSGLGIPQTIRRAVGQSLAGKPDDELILRAFSDGLSRHGMQSGRGCGLPLCARLAAEYGSDLYVRTPGVDVTLRPARPGQPSHLAEVRRTVGQLDGTHLCFEFRLDPSVLSA